jgi:hypothetical protein
MATTVPAAIQAYRQPTPASWVELLEKIIPKREADLQRLQLACTGLTRHSQLADKDGEARSRKQVGQSGNGAPRARVQLDMTTIRAAACAAGAADAPSGWRSVPRRSNDYGQRSTFLVHHLTHRARLPLPLHPPCAAIVALVGELRRDGITAIESIQAWRVASADSAPRQPGSQSPRLTRLADGTPVSPLFAPYMWGGRNYLQKMLHDADFVSEFPDVVRGGEKRRARSPLFPPSPGLPPPNTVLPLTLPPTRVFLLLLLPSLLRSAPSSA